MEPISGMIFSGIHSPSTVADVKVPPKLQRSEDKTRSSPIAHVKDEYIPEKKQEPSGRYWLGKDEDGQPKVYFDDTKQAADALEKQDEIPDINAPDQDKVAGSPEKKASGDKSGSCTCNTDKVDREIEKLKKKREELERQINSEKDNTKIKELEKKLARVESELRQKDNDAYRRQHSTFS